MRIETPDGNVDTEKAAASWPARRVLSPSIGTEQLFRSSEGRYYLVTESLIVKPKARFITDEEAARWLFFGGHELPEDLKKHEPACE